jgi:hypothetical protein
VLAVPEPVVLAVPELVVLAVPELVVLAVPELVEGPHLKSTSGHQIPWNS